MQKFILVILILLFSNMCFADGVYGRISNKRGFILQVFDRGALGFICPKWALDSDDCRQGQFVYFDFDLDFVDEQMFTLPKNYYFYADGVYKYTNKKNDIKTVRKISLISK